jgi:hypothetical protein
LSLIDEQLAAQLTRCRDRLNQVAGIKDGWRNGAGLGPTPPSVAAALRFLNLRFSLCDLYRIYPMEEGGVLFELDVKGWDNSVEFLADGKVQLHGSEVDGDRVVGPMLFEGVDNQFLTPFDDLIQ